MSTSDLLLPGQPVALPPGPLPQVGDGLYTREGLVRASVVGTPERDGPVRFALHYSTSAAYTPARSRLLA